MVRKNTYSVKRESLYIKCCSVQLANTPEFFEWKISIYKAKRNDDEGDLEDDTCRNNTEYISLFSVSSW